jgi:hypothetical protein
VVAIAQILLSDGLLYQPRQRLFLAGIVGNLAIIAVYLITRTVGIPFFGPHAGKVEDIGVIDLASVVSEMALVATLVALSRVSSSVGSSGMGWTRPGSGLPGQDLE